MTKVVYISYTTEDLTSQKDAVKQALERIQYTPRLTASSSARDDSTVDSCYGDIKSSHIFIGLVGHKLGWVPEHPSNPDNLSIVELEFRQAQKLGIPCLMFVGDDSVTLRDMDDDRTAIDQFRKKLLSGNECNPESFSYGNTASLDAAVLAAVALIKVNPEQDPSGSTSPLTPEHQALKHHILDPETNPLTDAQILKTYETLQTPDNVEAWLLKRWAHWSRRIPGIHTSAGQLQNTFVNLQLQLQSDDTRELQPEFEKLESESMGERTVLYEQLGHALRINSSNRPLWVLLGPPGAGKTTVLQHYELSCIKNALALIEVNSDEKPELCIWMRLSTYKPVSASACPDPQQWLEAQWKSANPGLPALSLLSQNFRLRYLLDGLNEIPAPVRAAATETWSDWTEQCRNAGQVLPPVFSVRQHEYGVKLRLPNDVPTEVYLRLWQRAQIREYIDKQLGSNNPLADQITEDNKLVEFYGLPLNLYHLCELYRSPRFKDFNINESRTLVYNRGRMYIGMLWLRLQRLIETENLRQLMISAELLTERQCQALTEPLSDFQQLRFLLEKCQFLTVLKSQALQMQYRGTQISVDEDTVAPELQPQARQVFIQTLEAARIAEIENTDQFRFVHQQWQEFFAALALAETTPGQTDSPDFTEEALESLGNFEEALGKLTVSEGLAAAPVGRWAETTRLLLELTSEKNTWCHLMANENAPLAAFAAEPVHKEIQGSIIEPLRDELLSQMTNPGVDLRQRLLCGHSLPMIGDPRYKELQGPQGKPYLIPTDDHMITIPAGGYQIGSLNGDNDEHCNGQLPQVILDEYRLSFAPVTNAEFARFLDAGGYADDQWWVDSESLKWRNGALGNTVSEQRERELRKNYLDLGHSGFREKYPSATDHQMEEIDSAFSTSDAVFERRLKAFYGAPGKPITEPEQWRNPLFNQPAQPVVGVCWFEAVAYCHWLASQSGKLLRLPTEAQWEVAARGFAPAEYPEYPWGDAEPADDLQMNADAAHLRRTSPVGIFAQSNTRGCLTDMAGNVQEWCEDWYGSYQSGPIANPGGPVDGALRVLRGGGWFSDARDCRSACRLRGKPSFRDFDVGFRFAQVDQPRSDR